VAAVSLEWALVLLRSLSSLEEASERDEAEDMMRSVLGMREVPAMSGASYESMFVVESSATGSEI